MEGPVLTVLGSGTLVPDDARHSSAHHLGLPSASVLLDCGPGTVHGFTRHGVRWEKLTHVVISHFHTDHVGDVAALMAALTHGLAPPRSEPLTFVGPLGLAGLLERLAAAFGSWVTEPGFEVRVVEVAAGDAFESADGGFTLSCRPTPHTPESVAWRVDGPWGSLGYTGDTGPSDEVAAFLAGVEVLVSECTFADGTPSDTHLTPSSLAALAERARPDLLVVVHVSPPATPAGVVGALSRSYAGSVVPGRDGLRVRWTEEGPAVDPAPALL